MKKVCLLSVGMGMSKVMFKAEVTTCRETTAAKKEAENTVFNEFRLRDQDLVGKHK